MLYTICIPAVQLDNVSGNRLSYVATLDTLEHFPHQYFHQGANAYIIIIIACRLYNNIIYITIFFSVKD